MLAEVDEEGHVDVHVNWERRELPFDRAHRVADSGYVPNCERRAIETSRVQGLTRGQHVAAGTRRYRLIPVEVLCYSTTPASSASRRVGAGFPLASAPTA